MSTEIAQLDSIAFLLFLVVLLLTVITTLTLLHTVRHWSDRRRP